MKSEKLRLNPDRATDRLKLDGGHVDQRQSSHDNATEYQRTQTKYLPSGGEGGWVVFFFLSFPHKAKKEKKNSRGVMIITNF